MFNDHIACFTYLLRHKFHVVKVGLKIGAPLWRLITHDASKFLPSEWFHYVHAFYERDGSPRYVETDAFLAAWNRHQKRNDHHWQFHVLVMDDGIIVPMPMPEDAVLEMVADWAGANIAINGKCNVCDWHATNRDKILLHNDTRTYVEKLFLLNKNNFRG